MVRPAAAVAAIGLLMMLGAAGPDAAQGGADQPPDAIVIYFAPGSAMIPDGSLRELDKAARLFREGRPILMTVAGSSDTTGPAAANLLLSQRRADVVFRGLVARGIPAERFEVLAKGEAQPEVRTNQGVSEARNRSATITWK